MQRDRFHPLTRTLRTVLLAGAATLLASCVGPSEWGQGRQSTIQPATDSGRIVQGIYSLVTWIDLAIFIVVFGLLAFAVLRYRVRPGQAAGALPKQVHGNALMELTWTIIPAIILIFIAVPTWSGIFRAARPPAQGAFIVEAIGHQWWWEFKYLDDGVTVQATPPNYDDLDPPALVVPVGTTIVIDIRSTDVIHSFGIPNTLYKMHAVPGNINQMHITVEDVGVYRGQCYQFCGLRHSDMLFILDARSQADYEAWLRETQAAQGIVSPADTASREGD
jgi:cytochrome c oxidase subunit 2